jgi:hypothetical protein
VLRADEHLGGKERGMNGVHRPNGVLFLSEPVAAVQASIADIAPTILARLGVAGPAMDGQSLWGDAASAPPIQVECNVGEPAGYTPEEERVIEARLRALGYFE